MFQKNVIKVPIILNITKMAIFGANFIAVYFQNGRPLMSMQAFETSYMNVNNMYL